MLDHDVGDVRERLEWLRQYIATTHPANRCPCQQRIGVADWHDHWSDCPVGQADLDDAADELNDRQNFIAAELKTGYSLWNFLIELAWLNSSLSDKYLNSVLVLNYSKPKRPFSGPPFLYSHVSICLSGLLGRGGRVDPPFLFSMLQVIFLFKICSLFQIRSKFCSILYIFPECSNLFATCSKLFALFQNYFGNVQKKTILKLIFALFKIIWATFQACCSPF